MLKLLRPQQQAHLLHPSQHRRPRSYFAQQQLVFGFAMRPQQRFFANPPTTTNEAAIATRIDGQLYVVLGAQGEGGTWQLRLWWKPFVTLIWFGGALIALGGALALVGRVWRAGRGERAQRQAARFG